MYRTKESLFGIGITAVGLLVYAIDKKVRPADFKPRGDEVSCSE